MTTQMTEKEILREKLGRHQMTIIEIESFARKLNKHRRDWVDGTNEILWSAIETAITSIETVGLVLRSQEEPDD